MITGFSCKPYVNNNKRQYLSNMLSKLPIYTSNFPIDEPKTYLSQKVCFASNNGKIYSIITESYRYAIALDGEIYNKKDFKDFLIANDVSIENSSDEELLLKGYIAFKEKLLEHLVGNFTFAIYDEENNVLFIARDHMGVKPMFYTLVNKNIFFSSKIAPLFQNDILKPIVDKDGLCQLLGLGPSRVPGKAVFQQVQELKPGNYLKYNLINFHVEVVEYFKIRSHSHGDNEQDTLRTIREFILDSMDQELRLDEMSNKGSLNISSLISGGIDSSIITTVASQKIDTFNREQKQEFELDYNSSLISYPATNQINFKTFSVDYKGNDVHFSSSSFTPTRDNDFIELMKKVGGWDHEYFILESKDLYEALYHAMKARDLPAMADIDSSLLLLAENVSKQACVTFSGEFADELFCGYPWFYKDELNQSDTFPWSAKSLILRENLLKKDLSMKISLKDYIQQEYNKVLSQVPLDETYDKQDQKMKILSYLTMYYFGANLVDRAGFMSSNYPLTIKVPFMNYHLVEYVYNIPWELKNYTGKEKGILREAFRDLLPSEIVDRKKSPYPKTFDPIYTNLVESMVKKIIDNPENRIKEILDTEYIREVLSMSNEQFETPWFGQLMRRPQLLGYLIQLEMWIREYNVTFDL